jgi:hypothetical protein
MTSSFLRKRSLLKGQYEKGDKLQNRIEVTNDYVPIGSCVILVRDVHSHVAAAHAILSVSHGAVVSFHVHAAHFQNVHVHASRVLDRVYRIASEKDQYVVVKPQLRMRQNQFA